MLANSQIMATTSDEHLLSDHERELVQHFIHELGLENAFGDGILVSQDEAIKFLMARKFDVGRAISLFHTHQMMRGKFELLDFDPCVQPLAGELNLGKFTVLHGKGKDGVTICVFYGKKHDPKCADHVTVLRGVVFQLDVVMKCVDVQRNGLALIYDMTNSSYANFDFDLAMKVLHLLKGGYPARLKAVYILCAPLWFRTSMAVLSTFLRDKIRDRVELIRSHEELQNHIAKEILPEDVGGISTEKHSEWIQQCVNASKNSVNHNTLNSNLPNVLTSITEPSRPESQTVKVETEKNGAALQNGITKECPPSPDTSSPPIKTQRTDKPPEKPLPPPPMEENHSNAENISTILNDTMSDMEKFLQHNKENMESNGEESNVDLIISELKKMGRFGIHKEYEQIKAMAPTGSFISTLYPINLRKNRYNNILAFEETRVKLEILNSDHFSDYINASYVDGYSKEKKFICTQGPLPQTFFDFWRMVWEQKVVVVVMVTRCVERGRTKCGKYWPEEDESATFGHLTVTNITCDVQDDFTSTLLEIHNSESLISRRVCHIQFTSWPDFGVLSSALPIIDAIDLIQQYQQEGLLQIRSEMQSEKLKPHSSGDVMELSGEYEELVEEHVENKESSGENEVCTNDVNQTDENSIEIKTSNGKVGNEGEEEEEQIEPPPIVIHCSAGVGRTGTFCCLSNSIETYHADEKIDIFQTVNNIRSQRAFSVQTADQYQFCYTGILEYIIKDRHEKGLDISELKTVLYNFVQSNQSDQ